MKNLKGLNVLVLGLGDSGLAMARWCARHGASVRVWDSRAEPPQKTTLLAEVPSAYFSSGDISPDILTGIEQIYKSPGLSPMDPRLKPAYDWAEAQQTPVRGELTLFGQALMSLAIGGEEGVQPYQPKVVAVTGTNGKTTTVSMTAQLIERAGFSVALAGNIGPTMLQTLQDALDRHVASPEDTEARLPDVWVLELSSFQLEDVTDFNPDAAAVLNITQDHLDWHGSMESYALAKSRIFGPTTTRFDKMFAYFIKTSMPNRLTLKIKN